MRKKETTHGKISIDRYIQEVLGFSIGSRDKKVYKSIIQSIQRYLTDAYCTDNWKLYKSLPKDSRLVGKKHTTQIESLNANVRYYLARFHRRTRCCSKHPFRVELTLSPFFFKNLISNLFYECLRISSI